MIYPSHSLFPWLQKKMSMLAKSKMVLDIGTSQRFAKEMAYFEAMFGDNYKALGYKPQDYGKLTCDYDGNILDLQFEDGSVDAIICLEVLEHVSDPFLAVREMFRVLKPGGLLLLSTPFLNSYHGKIKDNKQDPSHEAYPDYWRFTHQGLELLLKQFQSIEIKPFGGPIEFRISVFYIENTFLYKMRLFQKFLHLIDRPRLGKATTRHFVFAVK